MRNFVILFIRPFLSGLHSLLFFHLSHIHFSIITFKMFPFFPTIDFLFLLLFSSSFSIFSIIRFLLISSSTYSSISPHYSFPFPVSTHLLFQFLFSLSPFIDLLYHLFSLFILTLSLFFHPPFPSSSIISLSVFTLLLLFHPHPPSSLSLRYATPNTVGLTVQQYEF